VHLAGEVLTPRTQSKSQDQPGLKHGLFSYPILQAADVLLYRTTHVPVGVDQSQHLEFARECAVNFNSTYQTKFMVQPQTILSHGRRIMSLKMPTAKMSKSDPNAKSRILITDSPELIEARIRQAVTDSFPGISYDPEKRPGISNLIEILSALDPKGRTPEQLAQEMSDHTVRQLKMVVSHVVATELAEVRERFEHYRASRQEVYDFAAAGAEKAMQIAKPNMDMIRNIVGFI